MTTTEFWAAEAAKMRDTSHLGINVNDIDTDTSVNSAVLEGIDPPSGVSYTGKIEIDKSKPKTLNIIFKINPSYKVINCTESGFGIYQIQAIQSDIKDYLKNIFNFNYPIQDYVLAKNPNNGKQFAKPEKWTVVFKFEAVYSVLGVESFANITNSDLIIAVVDSCGTTIINETGLPSNYKVNSAGFHTSGGRIMVVGKSELDRSKEIVKRLLGHEEGHRIGLPHKHDELGIMSYTKPSNTIAASQKKELAFGFFWKIFQQLNFKVGAFSVPRTFGDAKSEVTDWLKSAESNFSGLKYKIPR